MKKSVLRAAIIGCSDGTEPDSAAIPALQNLLKSRFSISSWVHSVLYRTSAGKTNSPQARAKMLHEAFRDPETDLIFDISGGDAANGILPYLDFLELQQYTKPFFGYSDNSVLLNPLHQLAHIPVYYFQPRFLPQSAAAQFYFSAFLRQDTQVLVPKHYNFLQGERLKGAIAGGNIRCTLKLIGTPWQPDFSGNILFLESFSGGLIRIETMLRQYAQMGAFSQCSGILLGNFTELSKNGMLSQLYALVSEIVDDPSLPIVYTTEIGHQADSLCLPYHRPLCLQRLADKR